MARIAGVNIPTAKRVVIALTYITGIGPAKAKKFAPRSASNRQRVFISFLMIRCLRFVKSSTLITPSKATFVVKPQ